MYEYGDPFVPDFIGPNEFDSAGEALAALKSEIGESSSNGSSSYGSPSCCYVQGPSLIQRSTSYNSLYVNEFNHPNFPYLHESGLKIFELGTINPMRRAVSVSELQTINSVQDGRGLKDQSLLREKCNINGTIRVGHYSAEERKARIERYRSKRKRRNFNKKIMYECRKKLADSRTRIRGRFVRNEEINERSQQAQWMRQMGEDDDDAAWINLLDAFSLSISSVNPTQ